MPRPKTVWNSLCLAATLLLGASLTGGACAEEKPAAPVARYDFATPGASIADLSGNNHPATAGTAAKWVRSGGATRYLFTGQTGTVARAADNPALHFADASITISCWVAPMAENANTSGRERQRLLCRVTQPNKWLALDLLPTGEALLDLCNDSGQAANARSTGRIPAGNWTHLAVVIDRATRQIRFYLNGQADAVTPLPAAFTGSLDLAGAPLEIGGGWMPLSGFLDRLRVYAAALTPAELAQQYTSEQAHFTNADYERPLGLTSEFTERDAYAVFAPGATILLNLRVRGHRAAAESLAWKLRDFRERVLAEGTFAVPAGDADWVAPLPLPASAPGYYEVSAALAVSGVPLSTGESSCPAGLRTFAILPDLAAHPLAHPDDSRFGIQGRADLGANSAPFRTIYDAIGVRWVHGYRGQPWEDLPAWLEKLGPDTFKPCLDPARLRREYRFYTENDLAVLYDMNSVPPWLLNVPTGVQPPAADKIVPSHNCQDYAPRDQTYYANLLGRLAQEKRLVREECLPHQRRSYYKIHWEPDWYWKGSDAEFVQMYETASASIKQKDPGAFLLGPGFGVIAEGNRRLQRQFPLGLGKYIDGITTHSYFLAPSGENGSSPEEGGLVREARTLVRLARQYLPAGAPIMNTEGSSRLNGFDPAAAPWTLRRQAAWFLRTHLICLGEGFTSTWFFILNDMDRFSGYGLFYNRDLTRPHGARLLAPKPVFSAVAAATRLLEGTASRGALEYLGENVLGYAFDRAGENVVALWTTDETEREVLVPVGAASVVYYDTLGTRASLSAPGGVARVKLDGQPVYLLGVKDAVLPVRCAPDPQFLAKPTLAGAAVTAGDFYGAAECFALPGAALPLPAGTPAAESVQYAFVRGAVRLAAVAEAGGAVTVPAAAQPGVWLLQISREGQLLQSRAVGVLAPVGFELAGGERMRDALYPFVLVNRNAAALEGTLRLRGTGKDRELGAFTLAPGARVSSSLDLAALGIESASRTSYRLEFTDRAGIVSRSSPIACALTRAARVAAAPVIDGDAADWAGATFHEVATEDALVIRSPLSPYGGPDDLSLSCASTYDRENFYLIVRSRDQSHVQSRPAGDGWREDSLQLGLATGWNGQKWREWRKLIFALDGQSGKADWSGNLALPAAKSGVRCAIRRTGGQTVYEIAIPWKALDATLSGPPADGRVGIGILLNDRDAPPSAPTGETKKGSQQAATEQILAEAAGNPMRKAFEAYGGMFWQRVHAELGIVLLEGK